MIEGYWQEVDWETLKAFKLTVQVRLVQSNQDNSWRKRKYDERVYMIDRKATHQLPSLTRNGSGCTRLLQWKYNLEAEDTTHDEKMDGEKDPGASLRLWNKSRWDYNARLRVGQEQSTMGQRFSWVHFLETKYKNSNAVEAQDWLGVPCPRIVCFQPSPSLSSQSYSRFYRCRMAYDVQHTICSEPSSLLLVSYDWGHHLFESWAWDCMMEKSNSDPRTKEVKSKQKNGGGSLVLRGKTI